MFFEEKLRRLIYINIHNFLTANKKASHKSNNINKKIIYLDIISIQTSYLERVLRRNNPDFV